MGASETRSDRARVGDAIIPATKLEPPRARKEHIARPALLARLDPAALPKLTVVSAPAGHGKTTLLAAFVQSSAEDDVCYLSLDEDDGDPTRFWAGVGASLSRCRPAPFEWWARLTRRGAAPLTTLVPGLVDEASTLDRPVVLVLDDYHRLGRSEVHEQVGRLIEQLPPQLRLIVAARADPPLSLGRLRAGGELGEIRAADLQFSLAETVAFLNGKLSLGLSSEDVAALTERTEGWVAALYLAALALSPRNDRHDFVETFAGTNRFIVDYLGSEVLARLPSTHQDFLVRSSILDNLTGPLVDAVLDRSGSAAMLHELEASNLLLVPLDDDRQWYRFHHLFADLLRSELEERRPGLVPLLHERAFRWFASNGMPDQAIAHAIAGGSHEAAADLVAAHYWPYVHRGRVATVHRWLDALPEPVVVSNPGLCVAGAWVAGFQGRPAEVERWLACAATAERNGGRLPEGQGSVEAAIAVVRAGFTLGDVSAQVGAGRLAVEHDFTNDSWNWIARGCLGIGLFFAGDLNEAAVHMERATSLLDEDDFPHAAVLGRSYLALIELEGGTDNGHADALIGDAFALVHEHRLDEEHDTSIAYLARGKLLTRYGELEEGEAHLERAVALLDRGSNVLETAFAQLELALVRELRGNRTGARAVLEEAFAKLARCRDPGILADRLSAMRERLGVVETLAHDDDGSSGLTPRELEVLAFLPGKLSQREIGAALYVSFNTVTSHMKSIYRKLGVTSRRQAVDRARELHIL